MICSKTIDPPQYAGKYLADYDADFYRWSVANLPDARNYFIQDSDALIRSRSGGLQLIEIKRKSFRPKPYQERNIRILDEIIRHYFETTDGNVTIEINGRKETHSLSYFGFNLLQLTNTSFKNSSFVWNGEHVTEDDLIEKLSFDQTTVF